MNRRTGRKVPSPDCSWCLRTLAFSSILVAWTALASCGHGHTGADASSVGLGTDTNVQPDVDEPQKPDMATVLPDVDSSPIDVASSASEAGGSLAAGPVGGTVVGPWGLGVAGRTVIIGGKRVTTGARGVFSFDNVPATYDVIILEPNGSLVSIYYGLTRRDPILSHRSGQDYGWDQGLTWHKATVSGTLAGDFLFPIASSGLALATFRAQHVSASFMLGGSSGSSGPGFGPFGVRWEGSGSVVGTLYAVAGLTNSSAPWSSVFLAQVPLSLSDGDAVVKDLSLLPGSNGRIAGAVRMYEGNLVTELQFSYRFPNQKGGMGFDTFPSDGRFDKVLPDLSSFGGDYCILVTTIKGSVQAESCGAQIGMTNFTIDIPAPPDWVIPIANSVVSKDAALSWTAVDAGIYRVTFFPNSQDPGACEIHAYGAAPTMPWPKLDAIGAPFLAATPYHLQITAFRPYTSVDDFASSYGPYLKDGDGQELSSTVIDVTTAK